MLNLNMTTCPHCKKKMKLLDVLGMDNWRPTACSYCNKLCMATDSSLGLWFVCFLITIGAFIFSVSQIVEITKLMAGVAALIAWPITFPSIVKAKKYEIREYWLPKNRLLGYFVYLIVPVLVVVLAIAIAIHFKVGI